MLNLCSKTCANSVACASPFAEEGRWRARLFRPGQQVVSAACRAAGAWSYKLKAPGGSLHESPPPSAPVRLRSGSKRMASTAVQLQLDLASGLGAMPAGRTESSIRL